MAKRRKSATLKEKHYQLIIVILSVALATSIGFILTGPITGMAVADPNYVGKKVVGYLNDNIIPNVRPGTYVSLIDVEDTGSYYVITMDWAGSRINVYASKDGNYLFLNAFDLTNYTPSNRTRRLGFDAPDRETPDVKLFVMSFCPGGNQAEEAMAPAEKLLRGKIDFGIHYIFYENYCGWGTPCTEKPENRPKYCLDPEKERPKYCAMHGVQEARQNIRELCVKDIYGMDIFWDFVLSINKKCNSGNADTCWKQVAMDVGIDVNEVEECYNTKWEEYAAEQVEVAQQYGATGSPTFIVNNVVHNDRAYGRSPEAYKQAICSGFIDPPKECEQTLSGSSSSASGQC